MSEFKQGQMIEVGRVFDFSDKAGRREFIWYRGGEYWCISDVYERGLIPWKYARAIPEPKYRDFILETFPKCLVWVRMKGANERLWQASDLIAPDTVRFGNSWHKLQNLDEFEMSVDGCKTWTPCRERIS